jgi:superfamily II DNA/RNA helicase
MENFNSFGLNKEILKNLNNLKLTKPTPIQVQAIKPALMGKDILGSAHTGTGKTAAFGLPLIHKLMQNSSSCALILTPTRELAVQVNKSLNDLMRNSGIVSALIIGGESMGKQFKQLKRNPRLIIGTPGRVNDHLTRKSLNFSRTNYLVLDETDRMLDMGFSIQIEKIVKFLPKVRQTLLFSATLPKNIKEISQKYLHRPITISVDKQSTILTKIKHEVFNIEQVDKYGKLIEQINDRDGSIIIFVKTKHGSKRMSLKLVKQGFGANAIHGDLKQSQRELILNKFRNKKYRILVATDIAARGLDISHIEHVINYDLPQKPEDYIHRIGRTARAGLNGAALSFITPNDRRLWNSIDRLINPNYKEKKEKNSTIKNFKSKKFNNFKKKNKGFRFKNKIKKK